MRRDHRPLVVKNALDTMNRWYIDWFVRPQFDASGNDLRVMYPRHLQVSGPKVRVGDHVHFMALPDKPIRLAVFEGLGEIEIGDYSIVNPGVRMSSASSIRIGHSCMFAMNCYLSDADWHDIHHRIFAPGASAPIVLKDNVWIGDSALVTKGVTVGTNSIVGAWSVVTKDVPDNVVVVGNPARIVRELDTSHLTLRRDLFTGDVPYDDFEADYFRRLLAGNRVWDWVSSLVRPGRGD